MNNIIALIRAEWERSVLLLVILVISSIVGVGVYQYMNREDEEVAMTKPKSELPHYYDAKHLEGENVSPLPPGVNPMICEFLKPEPPPKPVPTRPQQPPKTETKPQQPPKTDTKPTPPPKTPETKPQQQPPKPTPPPPPPKPKKKRKVELVYIGSMSISGGNAGAQLRVTEILSAKSKNAFNVRLQNGGKILGGLLEVVSFDTNRVILKHSGNKEVTVPLRKKKITLEIEVDE